ncbi:methyltransferase-like protein, partial [Leptotrombidium deliense]
MNEARNAMHELLLGATKSYITFCVAKLNIVDLLIDKPMRAEELARLTSTNEELLYRLLRASVSIGLLVENEEKQFSVTDLGSTLKTGGVNSMKNLVFFYCDVNENPVSKLPELLQTQENKNNELTIFEKMMSQPEMREQLYGSIKEFNEWALTDLLVTGYDYSKFKYI